VSNYDLAFDLSSGASGADWFPAKAGITFDAPAPQSSFGTILEANNDRLQIRSVMVDGREVPFRHDGNRLFVDAPGAAKIDIDYVVKAVEKSDRDAFGLMRDKHSGRMWTLTWPYHTGSLFPSNADPSDGATAKVTLRVPPGEEAIASGEGDRHSFVMGREAPAYSIAFYTANRFAHGPGLCSCHGVTVSSHGIGKEVSEAVRQGYTETAKQALEFYSDWLGPYDYGSTLKLVETFGSLGGMEHTGAVAIMLRAAKDATESKEVAAHETAHHWFGDNIRIEHWGDFWMSEGFTNYATYRYFRHVDGEGAYHRMLDNAKDQASWTMGQKSHALAMPAHTDIHEIFDSIPYEMGPWVLRMMEVRIGTKPFDAMLRDWFLTKRQSSASTTEFLAFVKDHTGVDMSSFFRAWNKIEVVPALATEQSIQKQGTGSVVKLGVTAENKVPAGMELPAVITGTKGEQQTVMMSPGTFRSVELDFVAKNIAWDPERTLLANVRSS
jgi:aminopeptidase N